MKYRRLGRTGLAVSPISLGTMGFGPPNSQKQVEELILGALDLGINLLDTANCYDGPQRGEIIHGYAEEMIGKALKGKRDDVVLLTKAAVPLRPGENHRGLSPSHLLRELDNSLRRLQTDYVDVFMIHWPDVYANVEEIVRAVDSAVRAGKVRAFGISNHQAWQVCEFLWQGDLRGWIKPGVSELPVSILDRRYENDLPFYEKHEIGVLAYRALQEGKLSDKHAAAAIVPPSDAAPDKDNISGWGKNPDEREHAMIKELAGLACELNVSLAQYAMAWVLSRTAVATLTLGSRSAEQLKQALAAAEIVIPAEHLEKIDRLAPGPEKPVPRFPRD